MSNKGFRNLFVFGSLFFFIILLAMTFDTMKKLDGRAPEITEEVNQGKMLWHKYDCIGCHTILGNGSYFAPDLTKTTKNKSPVYLKKFLVNPRKVNPKAVMPPLGITGEESSKIVAFLDWISKVDTNGWPPEPVIAAMSAKHPAGSSLYEKQGCSACHTIKGIGGTSGPDLSSVGAKYTRDWHIAHLKNPSLLVPDSAMPPYGRLSEQELGELADYMLTLK